MHECEEGGAIELEAAIGCEDQQGGKIRYHRLHTFLPKFRPNRHHWRDIIHPG